MAPIEPPSGWSPGFDRDAFGAADIAAALARFAGEALVDEAASSRSRRRWLQQQLAEDTTFAGVLADLAERDRPVLVHTTVAARHRGALSVLGADFVGLVVDTGATVLVRLAAIAAIRTQPREHHAHSGRTVSLQLRFVDALAGLSQERPRVRLGTMGGESFSGDLIAVSQDVITLRLDGDSRATIYARVDALTEVSVAS